MELFPLRKFPIQFPHSTVDLAMNQMRMRTNLVQVAVNLDQHTIVLKQRQNNYYFGGKFTESIVRMYWQTLGSIGYLNCETRSYPTYACRK